jgi:glutamine---fructose-6-phosphate transaminase (isomerizing)
MDPMKPEVMIAQVEDLPTVMREQVRPFDKQVRDLLTTLEFLSLKRVYITGDGDSYHAARAAEMAFENIGGLPCEPLSAQHFLDYGAEWMPVHFPNSTLVVGISASGRTQRVVQSIERAREFGALTIALTNTPGSPVTEVADRTLCVQLPDIGRSPGIRSYQASLLGLLLLAIRIGELQDRYHQSDANAMRREISDLADVIERTLEATRGPAKEAAAAYKDATMEMWLGSGPTYGTALFSAAKVVEAAGVFAMGQDLEEWWHVERFAYPADMPTFIIAPHGRSHWRAVDLAAHARALGRRLVAITQEGDDELAPHADLTFPVKGEVREEFSPLVYHVPSNYFASFRATELGRMLFQTDNPEFQQRVAAYHEGLRQRESQG